MRLFTRIVNAIKPAGRRPAPGALGLRRPMDSWRDYPADGLTPQRLTSIFREADGGSISAQLALAEQMEEKDSHVFSVASTRRLAVTGLPWRIVPSPASAAGAGSASGGATAEETAAFCEETLRELPGFEETLTHLSLAVGRNIAVGELVWESDGRGLRLVELCPVSFDRLATGESGELRVLTDESPYEGMALRANKFVVHASQAGSGHPMRGGLARVTALAYLGKHFAIKDWLIFAEVFGMPVRIARYEPGATPEEKREMLEMLRQLGADATGVFSKAIRLEVIQSRTPGEVNLYENLCLYFDREISKAWLGQTLTTDTARMLASAGAAKVHDQVRRDLRDHDLRQEAHTIRRDVLRPLVRMRFGDFAPAPYFVRTAEQRFDPRGLAGVLDIAVNQLGARVPAAWVHRTLGIPEAGEGEWVLPGASGRGRQVEDGEVEH